MSNSPTTQPERGPSAASRRSAQGGPHDQALATRRRQRRPTAPLTPAERGALDKLLGDGQPQPTPPADPGDLPTMALLLHTLVPPATDHPYHQHVSPASTASHLAGRHGIRLGGAYVHLLAEQVADPDQLHRFAHQPTQQRVILGLVLDPLVDQLLDLLGQQLPPDLHPLVLAEAALAVHLHDPTGPAPPADQPPANPAAPTPTSTTAIPTHRRQPTPAPVRTVICYLRIVDFGRRTRRLLHHQRTQLQAACQQRGWTVTAWAQDVQPGDTLDRPGLQHALALLADHQADALLACHHTHLAITHSIANQLARLAATQGWHLLTLATLPPPTTTPPAGSRP
jgi:Resolvase, N terminal domain